MASPGTRQILYADRLESTIGTLLLIHDRDGHVRALDFHDFESRMRRLLRLHYGAEGNDFAIEDRAAPTAIRRAMELVLPTTANTPPRIADLADDKAFATQNLRSLRNCTLINMLDGCAISLPAHREGEVPVGLMLAAAGGSDRRIFELAAGMENIIRV